MDDRIGALARIPIFATLDEQSLAAVAALARVIAAPTGTVLVREGEAADTFVVIVAGTVRVERNGRFVRSLTDGGFLGEIGLIEDRDRTATATCVTDCEVVEFGRFEFGRVMATFPDVRSRVEAAVLRRPHAGGR